MDSYAERSTAVRIHKQGDWLQLGFISCVIDCCWHNSCQRRKWWLTNDRVELAAREITSALCEATRQSSHIPVSFSVPFFTATLNHCHADNTDDSHKHIHGTRRIASPTHLRWTSKTHRWLEHPYAPRRKEQHAFKYNKVNVTARNGRKNAHEDALSAFCLKFNCLEEP